MGALTKKPYEISLWEDQLIWHRRVLEMVQVSEEDYAPGRYYSQNSGAYGEIPFTLDFGGYELGQRYYKLHVPQANDWFESVLEGERPEDVGVPAEWTVTNPQYIARTVINFETEVNYYTYSNETGNFSLVDKTVVTSPEAGVRYYIIQSNRPLPNTLCSYYKEQKLCVIGSDTMDVAFRVFDGKFVTKVSGENTLTFSIYYKYFDVERGEMVDNPFLPYLTNERKVKLRTGEPGANDCKWYDLIIKQTQENSENKTFQYTCKDQFVNELSKTGFELVFDNELENNMGTVTYLGKNILEGSDWKLGEGNSILRQYVEEPLYEIKVKQGALVYAVNMLDSSDVLTLGENSIIQVFYSHINEQQADIQLLYSPNNVFQADDDLIIDKDFHVNYVLKGMTYTDGILDIAATQVLCDRYRGQRLVRQAQSKYDSTIDKYVSVYEKGGETFYGFARDEYLSPQAVFNYITNPNSFTSTTGWVAETTEDGRSTLSIVTYPQIGSFAAENWEDGLKEIKSYLAYTHVPGAKIMNTSISNHRSTIGSMAKNDAWIIRLKNKVDCVAGVGGQNATSDDYDTYPPNISLAKYKLAEDGSFDIQEVLVRFGQAQELDHLVPNDIDADGNIIQKEHYIYQLGRVNRSISEEELQDYNNRYGLFIERGADSKDYFIEDIELFPMVTYVKDEQERLCVPGGEFFSETRTDYYYYRPNKDIKDIKELVYETVSEGAPDLSFNQIYNDGEYTKVRSITGQESNRFNLLQDLCEKFECWVQYDIKRNNNTGEILLGQDLGKMDGDEAYRQQKFIVFKEYLRDEYNWAGFRYGVNEKSIQRTIDSNQIVSKMIVKDNANEFAKNGFCSIARAPENDIKENFLLNFDHYYRHKLLNLATVTNDLYLDSNGYLGYYKQLREKNAERDAKIERQANLLVDITHYNSTVQTYKTSYEAAVEEKHNIEGYIQDLTGSTFENFSKNFVWHVFHGGGTFDPDRVYYERNPKTGEYYRTKDTGPGGKAYYINDAYAEWDCNKEFTSYWTKYCQTVNVITQHEPIYRTAEKQLEAVQAEYDAISAELEQLRKEKVALNLRFYKKYSRFLQEGSWIKEDYVDDSLYYLDAKSTLHTSAQPKVTYNISVLELSRLPGYENYKFELGDRTYIEDLEFFGYSLKDSTMPYREEIVISEISMELDSPEKNSIKVQNYKTQFDDLFQRITASTQQAEYHSGEYQRAANVIEEDGTIKAEGLEKAFEKNTIALSNAKDQSVVIDEYGITTTSATKPDQMVRIISGGIYLSNDGGETWRTGLTGSGINTSILTSGQLNTKEILITSGDSPSFRWNQQGINAFYINPDGTHDPARFVRFDQYGIYGLSGTAHHKFDVNEESEKGLVGEERIWDEAQYALTWKGFMLKRKGTDGGSVSISSEDDFTVVTGSGAKRVQIGDIGPEGNPNYGIRLADDENQAVLETGDNGSLWLRRELSVGEEETSRVQIGYLQATKENDGSVHEVIHAGDDDSSFIVYEDGTILARSAQFEGAIKIGEMTIGEIEGAVEATKKLDISSKLGYNFKVGDTIVTPGALELEAVCSNIEVAAITWEGSADFVNWTPLAAGEFVHSIDYNFFKANAKEGVYYIRATGVTPESVKYSNWATITGVSDGKDALTIAITTSDGYYFKNGKGQTNLTAKIFKGGREIDQNPPYDYNYLWYDARDSSYQTCLATGKTITVTANDIKSSMTYVCNVSKGGTQ